LRPATKNINSELQGLWLPTVGRKPDVWRKIKIDGKEEINQIIINKSI
jgi:hypothetical protein